MPMPQRQHRDFRGRRPVKFKRVARSTAGTNKEAAIYLASNESFSITQWGILELDDGVQYIPLRGSLRVARDSLIAVHHLLTWVILRLPLRDIPEADRPYVDSLRKFSQTQMRKLETEMSRIGFPPTQFHGESYGYYTQEEEEIDRS